jgi:hypothetical protein
MCLEDGVGRWERQVGRLRLLLEILGSIVRFLFVFSPLFIVVILFLSSEVDVS